MEDRLIVSMIQCFFIAFGVIVGGTLIGCIGSYLTGEAPLTAMFRIAKSLRIWAVVAAIGGTFDAISNFEKGILDGSTFDMFKQIVIIVAAMGGVKAALLLFEWLLGEEVT
ncbi:sporulation protein [Halobacillus litoralis]|uniref:Sporulation protein n=1 Tax=Halobacillus litoralis TaxID=45668 RepID=A0A845DRA7_9BACI|nr:MULTISPECIES: YtrH family sporulation protein [Halobacillus]MCA1021891.1 YtrH family sporulation protein [Halobacillus litoralis]MYL20030.1 sporulation protein [Halobacillus litoralis]MYL29167.1 sporulation protein [Halobacillus halophilus]MYL38980.1 sporulation protein [Halobacillus litoralis]